MKKTLLLFVILLGVLFLSGCDYLPSDLQDHLTHELCANDPENPLCDLEILQDLEDDIVKDVVTDVVLKVKEKANKSNCSNMIAPDNPDLLAVCETDDYLFLPEGVDDFTPIDVVFEDDFFVVSGVTDDVNEELIIKVKLVLVDLNYYIEDWVVEYRELLASELTYEMVYVFIDQFVKDYQNTEVPTEEFCMLYYGGIDNDCDGREEFFDSGQSIELDYLDDDSDGDGIYEVGIILHNGDVETKEVYLFSLGRVEFGNVQISAITDGKDNDCNDSDVCE